MKIYVILFLFPSCLLWGMEPITKEITVAAPIPFSCHALQIVLPPTFNPYQGSNYKFISENLFDYIEISAGEGTTKSIIDDYKLQFVCHQDHPFTILEETCGPDGDYTSGRLFAKYDSTMGFPSTVLFLRFYSNQQNYAGLKAFCTFFPAEVREETLLARLRDLDAHIKLVKN